MLCHRKEAGNRWCLGFIETMLQLQLALALWEVTAGDLHNSANIMGHRIDEFYIRAKFVIGIHLAVCFCY